VATKIKRRIVIAGFGDTGLLVAAHLPKTYEVIGISTKSLLVSGQELGTRLTRNAQWRENYLMDFQHFKQLNDVEIIQGKVTNINADQNIMSYETVDGKSTSLSYDVLVIASGTTNGFWRTADIRSKDEIDAELNAHAGRVESAQTIAIIGAGPTGVSTASNLKDIFPDKNVHLFFRQDLPLSGYHPKTQIFAAKKLADQGVILHDCHEANIPASNPLPVLKSGTVSFASGQNDIKADCILWATGQTRPNNSFISDDLLNAQGFVQVNPSLQTKNYPNIFAIGDIAATDPHRSSARNAGFVLAAKNIDKFLSSRGHKMKKFRPPKHRWGSIFGIQNEGLRIFTPKGTSVRISRKWVKKILYPVFVDHAIYKGIDRSK